MATTKQSRIRWIAGWLAVALCLAMLMARPGQASTTAVVYNDFSDISGLVLSGNTASNGNPVFFGGQHVLRLTTGLWQAGGAFLQNPITLEDGSGFKASFSTYFQFQITAPVGCFDTDGVQGADGLVFVVQTASNQYGGPGGGIGYQNIPKSVGIEFDTWNNGSWDDHNGNHVGIDVNGNINSVVQQAVTTGHMNNGGVWHAWVDYDGDAQLLEVRVTQSSSRPAAATLSHTIDLPAVLQQPDAYVGFTSGTGCAGGHHDIRYWEFTNTFAPIGNCPAGLDWKPPLSASSAATLRLTDTLEIVFSYCDPAESFIHDESVIILVWDESNPDYPVTAWVYGSDIEIDDTAKEYRQTFDPSLYGLAAETMLTIEVYLDYMPAGSAEVFLIN